ncbi:MAG: biotin transporter BioY [Deltaproteobacteria bacterium]|nr:biotin transporter BioY [Deltaproteobacteria bacterium]
MTRQATAMHPPLMRHWIAAPTWAHNAGLAVGFSALLALSAQVAVPFFPVPVTGQTLVVLLIGAVLGPRLGLATVLLYLLEGAAGLPVFSQMRGGMVHLIGPTGGYLAAFPLAAWLVGTLAARGWDRRPVTTALAMLAGNLVIYALGLSWLGLWLAQAEKFTGVLPLLNMGLLPFLPGDALKILLAMVVLPGAWTVAGRKR